jgi:CRISPR-associated protein Csh2
MTDASSLGARSEILFVYDITDGNPNGDPNDENRPRMDYEVGRAKVSDVRLKRTIRDYLSQYHSRELFCKEVENADGTIQDGKTRAESFFSGAKVKNVLEKRDLIQRQVIEQCIDVRLFGATIPVSGGQGNSVKNSSVTLTGPVQFAMGTSLHRVEPVFIKGTGAFASTTGREQRTFREEYVLPYALIAFYGIVNQEAAKFTKLTNEDVELLYEAIWCGTRNLISRSKVGQRPLLLLVVEYRLDKPTAYIGRLDRFLTLDLQGAKGRREESIRNPEDVVLDLSQLLVALNERRPQIERLRFAHDTRLPLSAIPELHDGSYSLVGLPAHRFSFA